MNALYGIVIWYSRHVLLSRAYGIPPLITRWVLSSYYFTLLYRLPLHRRRHHNVLRCHSDPNSGSIGLQSRTCKNPDSGTPHYMARCGHNTFHYTHDNPRSTIGCYAYGHNSRVSEANEWHSFMTSRTRGNILWPQAYTPFMQKVFINEKSQVI